MEIPKGSFLPKSMIAKCCFQVWERTDNPRTKVELPLTHEDFDFFPYKERHEADFAIRGAGSNIGYLNFDLDIISDNWHFIKVHDPDNLEVFETMPYYPTAGNTVRQDSLGKADLIYIYTEHKKKLT